MLGNKNLMSRIAAMCPLWGTCLSSTPPHLPKPLPPSPTSPHRRAGFWILPFALWPRPHWPVIFGHTSAGNFPLSQVAGCRCTLLAGSSSISLAGSEEQVNFSQQSPKMLKMASESFIHALLLFLGLFHKICRWVPLNLYWRIWNWFKTLRIF